MLHFYLVTVIIWFIILIATSKIAKPIMKNKGIDYSKYFKNKSKTKISFFTISFIPIIRLITWFMILIFIGADEKQMDELFLKNKEE